MGFITSATVSNTTPTDNSTVPVIGRLVDAVGNGVDDAAMQTTWHCEKAPSDESFESLRVAQQTLERLGWHFFPIPKEHCESPVTGPLLQRIRTHINKRGFGKNVGRPIITFSGFAEDRRELFATPELPTLLGMLPEMGSNGPGMRLTLLGEVDEIINRPLALAYDLHVVKGEKLTDDAIRRIRLAARKYNLKPKVTQTLTGQFLAGASSRW